jgi:hypothetical protein
VKAKNQDPKILQLDDLEQRQFWGMILMVIALSAALVGMSMLIQTGNRAMDQVEELSDRVERLSVPPASTSEQPKT